MPSKYTMKFLPVLFHLYIKPQKTNTMNLLSSILSLVRKKMNVGYQISQSSNIPDCPQFVQLKSILIQSNSLLAHRPSSSKRVTLLGRNTITIPEMLIAFCCTWPSFPLLMGEKKKTISYIPDLLPDSQISTSSNP